MNERKFLGGFCLRLLETINLGRIATTGLCYTGFKGQCNLVFLYET